jgi:hypothetical protein
MGILARRRDPVLQQHFSITAEVVALCRRVCYAQPQTCYAKA